MTPFRRPVRRPVRRQASYKKPSSLHPLYDINITLHTEKGEMRKNILILGHNDATQFIDIYNQYARIFDQDKYAVTVAYLSGKENAAAKERTLADEVIFLDTQKKSLRGLKITAIRQLLALNREKNFEMVICHRYKPAYVMMWVAQFCKIPKLFF